MVIEKVNAEASGAADCDANVAQGADPKFLCEALGRRGADQELIDSMGAEFVCTYNAGAPEYTEQAWQEVGLPWCARYAAAYAARAAELADPIPDTERNV